MQGSPWKVKDDVQGWIQGHPEMRGSGGKLDRLIFRGDYTDRQKYLIAAGDTELELGHKGEIGHRGVTKAQPDVHTFWGLGTVV